MLNTYVHLHDGSQSVGESRSDDGVLGGSDKEFSRFPFGQGTNWTERLAHLDAKRHQGALLGQLSVYGAANSGCIISTGYKTGNMVGLFSPAAAQDIAAAKTHLNELIGGL